MIYVRRVLCMGCTACKFTDKDFPPGDSSLGMVKALTELTEQASAGKIGRVSDLSAPPRARGHCC
jgi:hypothetical protein